MLRYFGNSCFIAELDNKIIGFAMGFQSQVDKNKFFLWQIGVNPKYRGKEIGKRLLGNIDKVARRLGCECIELTVDPENIPSQKLFLNNGYKNISSREGEIKIVSGVECVKNYYKPGRHFILFVKNI